MGTGALRRDFDWGDGYQESQGWGVQRAWDSGRGTVRRRTRLGLVERTLGE
jgi:hypothetical protein